MGVRGLPCVETIGTIKKFRYVSSYAMLEKLLSTWMRLHISADINHYILHYHQLLSSLTHAHSKLLHSYYPPCGPAIPRQLDFLSALDLVVDLDCGPYHKKDHDVRSAQRVVVAPVVVPDHTQQNRGLSKC